jgi:hypothetical protein
MLIENGKIASTSLGIEDHGIFSSMIMIEFNGSVQGFGGWALDKFSKELDQRIGTAFGCQFILELLKTLEVSTWDELKGLNVRVKRESDSYDARIVAIGHIIKNQWFNPMEIAEKLKEAP